MLTMHKWKELLHHALYLGADRYLKAKPIEINIIGRDKVEEIFLKNK
jgi:hypothetical protein